MRRATLITIIVLFVLIGVAAVYQMAIATNDRPRYPGPQLGTPFPSTVRTP